MRILIRRNACFPEAYSVSLQELDKNRMNITFIRQDSESGKETLSVCEAGTLFDKMKTETKSGHIMTLRELIESVGTVISLLS